jgi:hypothetical protein
MNREPREPREKKEPKWNLLCPKPFTQQVQGGLSKNLCLFAYFAVLTAGFGLNNRK